MTDIGDNNLRELFFYLIKNFPNKKTVSRSGQESYAKHLILFLGKFIIKFGPEVAMSYLEMTSKGFIEILFKNEFDSIFELDSVNKRKIVSYSICVIMRREFNKLSIPFLKYITAQLIELLDKFYKPNTNTVINDNKLTVTDSCVFEANSSNKLQNTEVRVSYKYLKLE